MRLLPVAADNGTAGPNKRDKLKFLMPMTGVDGWISACCVTHASREANNVQRLGRLHRVLQDDSVERESRDRLPEPGIFSPEPFEALNVIELELAELGSRRQ